MYEQDSKDKASGAKADAREAAPSAEEHITLAQAAKLAPGRPSSNCVWRWCREGVKAASGTRVRLKHVRFGSRIFTTRKWLNDFGLALAEADAVHFDRDRQHTNSAVETEPRQAMKRSLRKARTSTSDECRRRHRDAERELDEAGL